MDDNLACPRCKTTKYRNPSLKLLVNSCGHALCDNCVELLFVKGSGACPECGIPLRRSNFRVQLFEDPVVEKEVDIRRRVLKDFTKQQSDFESLREYNDYLEQVETIIFNLTNNIDIIETNKIIEQYKKDNKEQIQKSRSRKPDTMVELEQILDQEKRLSELRRVQSLTSEKEEKLRKIKSHEALIDDLMFLEDVDAKSIVQQHKATAQAYQTQQQQENTAPLITELAPATLAPPPPTQFTSGIGFGIGSGLQGSKGFLPVPKTEAAPLFKYKPFIISFGGPEPPSLEELRFTPNSPFLQHIRPADKSEYAGGYHHSLACRRALQDAFMDIAMQPKILFANKSATMLDQHYHQEDMDTTA